MAIPFITKKSEYLDLRNQEWKKSKKWHYVGIPIIIRPFKKSILAISLFLCSLSFAVPDLGIGVFSGLKLLRRYG